jgi:hypothetical protein
MRLFILSVLAMLLLASCAPYQYITLNSPEVSKNDKKDFTWENDTLRLTYNFHGEKGLMTLTIYNKTTQPLFINWKRSALIRDGHSISLYNPTVQVTGDAVSTSYPSFVRDGVRTRYTTLSASFDLPEGMDFLPPASDVSKGLVYVQQSGFSDMAAQPNARKEKLPANDGVVTTVSRVTYEAQTSPIQFKSYLTFALGGLNDKEFAVSHSFYATEVVQSRDNPQVFALYGNDGDKLYVRQATVQQ